ncbi:MAG: TatD family hydrolase [Rectinema sp.]
MYCDAHIHLVDLDGREPGFARKALQFSWRGAVVSHDPAEFLQSEALRAKMPPTIAGFGIHPQNPDMQNATFLSSLCDEKKIQFIGETGFDFFGDGPLRSRNPDAMRRQAEAFLFQARLAARAQLPLVVHLRKATDVFMAYGRELDGVPSVIFHCWPGRLEEAKMILKKGINAYFSFGTPLLRDSKHAIESLLGLPASRILSETDAPWQPPHGSAWTRLEHIVDITDKMAHVLELDSKALAPLLEKNFTAAYLLDN